ncbi:MAG: PD-(D/E)XK nuclease family protein [Elainellaceae cyanobacterium]
MGRSPVTRISQGQLNLLDLCPRQFQHVYLDQLAAPLNPDQQESLDWGSQFHLLMQQRELGLPIVALTPADPALQRCVWEFVEAAPEVFAASPDQQRHSEHRRTLPFQDYLLTVVYDLLVQQPDKAEILDWKTYGKPKQPQWLAQHWQTRLYRFVLAETSDYAPEQITMTYWFVRAVPPGASEPQPQRLSFSYSREAHEQTRQDLTQRLSQLTHWLTRYDQGEAFPRQQDLRDNCTLCGPGVRCWGDRQPAASPPSRLPDLSAIAEVPLES